MTYADTNFFTSLYVDLPHREGAESLAASLSDRADPWLPITLLIRLELINAFQQCVFLSRHGAQQLRMTPELALLAEELFLEELREGEFLRDTVVADDEVEACFYSLCHRYTAREGYRTYDLLHIAAALTLGCDTFWSFDARARSLARQAGLATNE